MANGKFLDVVTGCSFHDLPVLGLVFTCSKGQGDGTIF